MGWFSKSEPEKGDYIEVAGYEQDVDTAEVLAVLNKPGKLDLKGGISYQCAQKSYLTEYREGCFELVPEYDVKKVHKGR